MALSQQEYRDYEIDDIPIVLPAQHFLSLGRPDVIFGGVAGVPDTTTLAAHDFDLDNRTGFLPPQPPLQRLPPQWEHWEEILDLCRDGKLQLAEKPSLTEAESLHSEGWRDSVRLMPLLPIDGLVDSEIKLRRAHHVLTFILHSYIHSLPLDAPILIPEPLAIPLLRVSQHLALPPVLTYSDDVLYNWDLVTPSDDPTPAIDNLRCQTLMTGTSDEEEFYLASTRIELCGVQALEIMRSIMDEAFVGDGIAIHRITGYLQSLAEVVPQMRDLLLKIKDGVNPDIFYNQIRPWFRGMDPDGRHWEFEGLENHPELEYPPKLAGPSAGQSTLIHSMDIFLGTDEGLPSTNAEANDHSASHSRVSLLEEMRNYMPRHHRRFLVHLQGNPRPVRQLVANSGNEALVQAYNAAVKAVKELRDAHLIIVTMYIIQPAKRARVAAAVGGASSRERGPLKGTGGTDLVKFLKGVRDRTARATLDAEP